MNTPLRRLLRGAGGKPLALLLLGVLLAWPVGAQPVPEPPVLSLGGRPVAALAAHPDLSIGFRSVTRGRQTYIFRHLRAENPGQLALAEGRYIYGWTCAGGDCAESGLFLGYDSQTERLYLLLLDEGVASLTVPTRGAPWPAPLAEAVLAVKPDLRRFSSE